MRRDSNDDINYLHREMKEFGMYLDMSYDRAKVYKKNGEIYVSLELKHCEGEDEIIVEMSLSELGNMYWDVMERAKDYVMKRGEFYE